MSLVAAVRKGLKAVEVELAGGADLDEKDDQGRTALLLATRADQVEIVARLLDAGADPDAHGKRCRQTLFRGLGEGAPASPSGPGTLVHEAAYVGAARVLGLLLERGLDPSPPDKFGDAPLHHACFGHSLACAERLLDAGVDVNALDRAGYAPLDHAHLTLDTLRLLLARGARPEGGPGYDTFTAAASGGRLDVVNLLVEHGLDVTAHPEALPLACKHGRADVVRKLVALGADLDATTRWRLRDAAALPAAAMYASVRTVELLLDACAHQLDDALATCVALSSDDTGVAPNDRKAARLQTVELLLGAGAAPRAALHEAARARDPDYLKRLLKAGGFEVDAPDEAGHTPLLLAAREGHKDSVLLLLAAGADPRVTDADGRTPFALVDENGLAEDGEKRIMKRALKDAGGGPVVEESAPAPAGPLGQGDRVRHKKFGAGTVLSAEGEGDKRKLRIEFDGLDERTLLARFVERIE